MKLKIAVVGATGLVGQMMLRVLEEQGLNDIELLPVASGRSRGKKLWFNGKEMEVLSVEEALDQKPQVALFSAGAAASLAFAPLFAKQGTLVVDNSSAWRKDPNVPLVVPEINAHTIESQHKIIANPNCSTIQMVAALAPLLHAYGIERLVISTYQSVSGSGIKGIDQLEAEQQGRHDASFAYPHQIHMNVIPHGGDFDADGNTSEEQKLMFETRKILQAPDIAIAATVVRVPVVGGHSMSVNVELQSEFDIEDVRDLLENSPGIVVQDKPAENFYPMPLFAHHKDEVFVGRIRRDQSIPNGLNLWIVADNLRKGAATNAVQIVKSMIDKGLI
jgi:aspartate-semialdehyde dehydrogenase